MRLALALAACAACGDNSDPASACRLGTAQSAATVQDRRIIGPAAPYAPDLGLASRDDELRTSIAARRQAAWQIVQRVLAPVPLGDLPTSSLPAWHTWYARDDFERTFKHLYAGLGPTGRRARAAIDATAGLAWNAVALDGLPDWPEQRYLDYLAQVDSQLAADGVGDADRVSYSPGAMAHLVDGYARQYACRLAPDPDPFAPEAIRPGALTTQTQRVVVAGCELHALSPIVAGDAPVTVATDGEAEVYVRRGAPPDVATYDCKGTACTVDGDGAIYLAVLAATPAALRVDATYLATDVADPACLDGAMPRDAVLVKADWRRVFGGQALPTYDTSAARLRERLAGDATWNADGAADPDPAAIYSVLLSTGQQFRMPALHVMTKELDHWMWITLWWSPEPDADFGADRPASLGGVWRNYKMCTASAYLEGDPDPHGGQAGTLGAALAAVHGGTGAPSWCANPYLEMGAGNAATNCIGCHQHGGTAATPEQILALPGHGATRVRNNFPSDYLWAIKGGGGDDLSSAVQVEIEYWDANDP